MGIDPAASGAPSSAHIPLTLAHSLARSGDAAGFTMASGAGPRDVPAVRTTPRSTSTRSAAATSPHTPVKSSSSSPGDPDRWDQMLNRLGARYNVPPLLLKSVMLIESGGDPGAVGDSGHSVGLFQLHDQGYGHGMGDARFDPEANADRAARGLAESWHDVTVRQGLTGEYALRATYDHSFNPGGGFAYQGDALVNTYNGLLAAQGNAALT